jgi:hypothetical protein
VSAQLDLRLPPGRGGYRRRAGRKRRRTFVGVTHTPRPRVRGYEPQLVTMHVERDVRRLRRSPVLRAFRRCLRAVADQVGFRVVHYGLATNNSL